MPKRPARSRQELQRLLSAPDEVILVAADDEVVALVHAQIYDTPAQPSLVPRRRAHVDHLIVTAGARRRGWGRRLVETAAEWARDAGASEILLTVWAGNDAAEKFYAALGFGRVSSVLGRKL